MKYIRPLQLGSLTLPSNIFYAPLAGCSDFPFRKMSARYTPGLMFCEMVKMDALVRSDYSSFRLLDYDESMRPIGAQLCGSKLQFAKECARIVEDLGFDTLDLNCGCPVDKVTKDGSGSAMLKTPWLIGDILHEMASAVSIPVTVKVRCGWDEHSINAPQITQIAELAGAKAITIHGRTRVQGYKGLAERSYIKESKAVAKDIKVIGNGDVFCGHSGIRFFEETGCDGILAARGTMGQPWIAEDIRRYDQGLPALSFTGDAYKQLLMDHLAYCIAYGNDKKALLDLRRVGCWYLKKGKGTKAIREGINKAKSLDSALEVIQSYDWSSTSFTIESTQHA